MKNVLLCAVAIAVLALPGCRKKRAEADKPVATHPTTSPAATAAATEPGDPADGSGQEATDTSANAENMGSADVGVAVSPDASAAVDNAVVFDPAKPPAPWLRCHRFHCHKPDGSVDGYVAVMKAMAATAMVGNRDVHQPMPAPAAVSVVPKDATDHGGGLFSKVLEPGHGARRPKPTSTVRFFYAGWNSDGEVLDRLDGTTQPAVGPLERLMKGWRKALAMMREGEVRRFWLPESLTYQGQVGKPRGTLVYDFELLKVMH